MFHTCLYADLILQQVHSITWNQLSPRGLQQSYCFRFGDKEAFEHFKEAFIKCQYEMLNDIPWEKVKVCKCSVDGLLDRT